MLKRLTLEDARRAMQQPRPGMSAHALMAPPGRPVPIPPDLPPERRAAVLLLLYPHGDQVHFVLTRRAENLERHAGQISLPGGRYEASDGDLWRTALRESEEELGANLGAAEALGALTPLYVSPSRLAAHPFVAALDSPPLLAPRVGEVAEAREVPLGWLLEAERRVRVRRPLDRDGELWAEVPAWRFGGWEVWGATAMLLSEFAVMLDEACTITDR